MVGSGATKHEPRQIIDQHPAVDEKREYSFRRFFVRYLWVGVVLVLVAAILNAEYPTPPFLVKIAIEMLSAFGIALALAALFSFTADTTEFVNIISERLQSIVISRKFLNNMDDAAKRDILNAVIQPREQQRDLYGNIQSYYRYYINRTLAVRANCVRSQYECYCVVSFSEFDNTLVAEYTNNYRLYPSETGFKPIIIGFYGEDKTSVSYEGICLQFPSGRRKVFSRQELLALPVDRKEGGDESRSVPIDEFGEGESHVDVEARFMQKGQDHWIQVGFQAQEATDGFRFRIHCEDPLVIKEEATFIFGARYSKEPTNLKGQGKGAISCGQWIEQGSGVMMVVAAPHTVDPCVFEELKARSHGGRRAAEHVQWGQLGSVEKNDTNFTSIDAVNAIPRAEDAAVEATEPVDPAMEQSLPNNAAERAD